MKRGAFCGQCVGLGPDAYSLLGASPQLQSLQWQRKHQPPPTADSAESLRSLTVHNYAPTFPASSLPTPQRYSTDSSRGPSTSSQRRTTVGSNQSAARRIQPTSITPSVEDSFSVWNLPARLLNRFARSSCVAQCSTCLRRSPTYASVRVTFRETWPRKPPNLDLAIRSAYLTPASCVCVGRWTGLLARNRFWKQ